MVERQQAIRDLGWKGGGNGAHCALTTGAWGHCPYLVLGILLTLDLQLPCWRPVGYVQDLSLQLDSVESVIKWSLPSHGH